MYILPRNNLLIPILNQYIWINDLRTVVGDGYFEYNYFKEKYLGFALLVFIMGFGRNA
jgi:hypothetical protein